MLVFLAGCLTGAYMAVRYYTFRMIEYSQMQQNAMDIYKSVAYLEFLEKGHDSVPKVKECLEWDLDQGLLGLSRYTHSDRMFGRLDAFSLKSLKIAKEYRLKNPRTTKTETTDTAVASVLAYRQLCLPAATSPAVSE